MKPSGYFKSYGRFVTLKTDYDNLDKFQKVFIAKAIPCGGLFGNVLELPLVTYGGTGFFYDDVTNPN